MKIYCVVNGDFQTNTYILAENNNALVVDPGCEPQKIIECLTKAALTPKFVLVTHCHFDHTGTCGALQKSGAKIYVSKIDYELLKENNFCIDLGIGEKMCSRLTAIVWSATGINLTF